MDIVKAIIMGIVEGLTEFLPISSTGHMILVGHIIHFEGKSASVFEVVIQLGSMLAIAFLYWKRYVSLLNPATLKKDNKRFNIIHVFLGILPAGLVGVVFHDFIKTLFSPAYVLTFLILGAFLMIYADKKNKIITAETIDQLTYMQSFKIGLFQIFAVLPGFSRAGSTISGGLLVGANPKTAAEFSFLIALPVMIGATGLDLLKNIDIITGGNIPVFIVGFITAFIVAMLAVVSFLKLLERVSLSAFAYYRILLAVLFALFIL
ncbi:undecaprenyl-diphosphate phosphatase [Bacillus sp. 1P06AnD]|uniref:undecaprenyl-diphosphate phosphatase n=1 Tax=Bacillus sp. 1P06AnD TaxID=3132208 RepID=UPI0039A177BB